MALTKQSARKSTGGGRFHVHRPLWRSRASAYEALELRSGLIRKDTYIQAVGELSEVMIRFYSAADAEFRELIEADIVVAAASPLAEDVAAICALRTLMDTVERILPQSKALPLTSEFFYKERQRQRLQGAAEALAGSGSSTRAQKQWGTLRRPCLDAIMKHLDPLSLAACASTCRAWRDAANAEDLWSSHLNVTFGDKESAVAFLNAENEISPHRRRFRQLATRHPAWLLPWHSHRVLMGGEIKWVSQGVWEELREDPGDSGMAYDPVLDVAFLTSSQVVGWLFAHGNTYLDFIRSRWRERMNARDAQETHV